MIVAYSIVNWPGYYHQVRWTSCCDRVHRLFQNSALPQHSSRFRSKLECGLIFEGSFPLRSFLALQLFHPHQSNDESFASFSQLSFHPIADKVGFVEIYNHSFWLSGIWILMERLAGGWSCDTCCCLKALSCRLRSFSSHAPRARHWIDSCVLLSHSEAFLVHPLHWIHFDLLFG